MFCSDCARQHPTSPAVHCSSRSTAAAAPGSPPSSSGYAGSFPASGIVHTDDIAWNHACFDWGDLMVENILRPLHRGEGVEFRPPAWVEHDRPGAIRVPAGADVVWVEGTGIIREELRPVDRRLASGSRATWTSRNAGSSRGTVTRRPEQDHIAGWLAEELPLMLREQPWHKATIVVAGTTELDHDPDAEIVVASSTVP